jgi:hypothetical protein
MDDEDQPGPDAHGWAAYPVEQGMPSLEHRAWPPVDHRSHDERVIIYEHSADRLAGVSGLDAAVP